MFQGKNKSDLYIISTTFVRMNFNYICMINTYCISRESSRAGCWTTRGNLSREERAAFWLRNEVPVETITYLTTSYFTTLTIVGFPVGLSVGWDVGWDVGICEGWRGSSRDR